ncbi:MAG: 50S ribosome-binding GTPase [Magnetococcales bacterium]|nr:50S ribosome-binding GTPase [Magnetococcales bacterium]
MLLSPVDLLGRDTLIIIFTLLILIVLVGWWNLRSERSAAQFGYFSKTYPQAVDPQTSGSNKTPTNAVDDSALTGQRDVAEVRKRDRVTQQVRSAFATVGERIRRNLKRGAGTDAAEREMRQLAKRQDGVIEVAFLGEISVGKSALISALVPTASLEVDARGGTTREIGRYTWRAPDGGEVRLLDLPGLNEVGGELEGMARQEAMRSHCLVYVCDGDLTRSQWGILNDLVSFGKPVVLALNKADYLTPEEREGLLENLQQWAGSRTFETPIGVAPVVAGGVRPVTVVDPTTGFETEKVRPLTPEIESLLNVLLRVMRACDPELLEAWRSEAVAELANQKLDLDLEEYTAQETEQMIHRYALESMAMTRRLPWNEEEGFQFHEDLAMALIKSASRLHGHRLDSASAALLVQQVGSLSSERFSKLMELSATVLKGTRSLTDWGRGAHFAVGQGLVFVLLGWAAATGFQEEGADAYGLILNRFRDYFGDQERMVNPLLEALLTHSSSVETTE